MYQYADKGKSQSETSKAKTFVTNKSSVQAGTKIPAQTKSLFIFSHNLENSRKQNEEQKQFESASAKPNNTGIPLQMKNKFENLSGFSFDDVRVHYNSDKPAQLQALAYTQGNQVYVGPGQERHLGHELGHVVQQKQGRVRPTAKSQGINVNDDGMLEKDADVIREDALKNKSELLYRNKTQSNQSQPIQKVQIVNVIDNEHQDWNHFINTLADLNGVLAVNHITPLTVGEIFKRLRPNGHVGAGDDMFTRNDGIVIDQYVQRRIGNLANNAIDLFANQAIENVNHILYDNQTVFTATVPAGLTENERILPRQQLLGYIRTALNTIIAQEPVKDITVSGGNGYILSAGAAEDFIDNYGAKFTNIVTALSNATVNASGAWNRVRTIQHNQYHAELKLAGIANYRVFAPTGSNILSVVGAALH